MSIIEVIPGLVIFAILIFLYFLPSVIAYKRTHRNFLAIFVLNLFLGTTFVGWVGAFIWAVINDRK